MINVGDYVKVKGEGRHRGWMPYMDSFIGTVYKVTNVVREVDEGNMICIDTGYEWECWRII